MARVTHVKKAQQRYRTVPVLDDEGKPKRTPVMRKDGTQKTTKRGTPIFMTVTMADKSQPLDPYTCDYCHKTIEVGTSFKHISPRSGPYGGHKRTRHERCPSWQVWEYSSSLSARLAQISHDFWQEIDGVESTDDVQGALDSAAEEIRSLAEEKREGASNIEEGFDHPTATSEELESVADELETWADDVSSADVPEPEACTECDGTHEVECPTCDGDGKVEDEDCEECDGSGTVDCEAGCDEDGMDIVGWRESLQDSLTIVDECPV